MPTCPVPVKCDYRLLDPLADQGRVGVGVPDTEAVDDHDVRRARAVLDGRRHGLHRAGVGVPQCLDHLGRRGGRLRDSKGALFVLMVELTAHGTCPEHKADRAGEYEDQDLSGQQLRGQGSAPPEPPSPDLHRPSVRRAAAAGCLAAGEINAQNAVNEQCRDQPADRSRGRRFAVDLCA